MATKRDDSGAGQDRSGWLGYVQIIVILAAIAVALYFAQAPERVRRDVASDLGAERSKPVVDVIRPKSTGQALDVVLTGSVRTQARITVMSEVVGRVAWLSPNFRNGGAVAANEPIARIDSAGFEIRVAAAKARVETAESRLQITRSSVVRHAAPRRERGSERRRTRVVSPRDADREGTRRARRGAGGAESRKSRSRAHGSLAPL